MLNKTLYGLIKTLLLIACAGCSGSLLDEEGNHQDIAEADTAESDDALAHAVAGADVFAEVVAIDQVYVFNRFGSFNPSGMVYALKRDVIAADPSLPLGPGNATLREGKRARPLVLRVNVGETLGISFTNWLTPAGGTLPGGSPATRRASIHVDGLQMRNIQALGAKIGNNPDSLASPGETRNYLLSAAHEGTFLMHSTGAMVGGQFNGGQLVQGLFGAVHVEPAGSVAYRSQVTADDLVAASRWPSNPDGTPRIDYDALDDDGEPILAIRNRHGEIVHGDLNAIITGFSSTQAGTQNSLNQGRFRELTVIFHDGANAVQAFPEFNTNPALRAVGDGFGVNYGSSGLGAELLASRAKLGPAKDCDECKFEEFFLSSWANGDPALIIDPDADGGPAVPFLDDPSNVQHGYVGDPTRFRNLHAGPLDTHVFHLHAQQWFRTPGSDDSSYLDSQGIAPGEAFTYDISYGGGGNRNLTPGDSIFHCHLYPHFVQGMWGLWRSHDVFEAGTSDRKLPDGELASGTPVPAVVPIPGLAMAPMPTYAPTTVTLTNGTTVTRPPMPGYPFYIAAVAGHRPPQPPLDLDHDGGLPRHIVTSAPVISRDRGEYDAVLLEADLKLLPSGGTPSELAAADFHAGQFPGGAPFTTPYGFPARAYPSFTPEGQPARFAVNGLPPRPGAPYADPCPPGAPVRTYRAAYVQVDGVVNGAGWHDPQMRLAVLEHDVDATLDGTRPPEPLFFRASSGECVVFKATNLIPDVLQQDDFQIFTPTDIIGQHIHLVKFDVTSSDGAANGFNYEDGTFAAEEVIARIDAANARGGAFPADGTLLPQGGRVALSPSHHPTIASAPLGAQTTIQRWWADPLTGSEGKDRTIRTAFSHDHFSASSHQHHGLYAGLVVEPVGSVWRDPKTGEVFGGRADGGPTSYRADIYVPGSQTSNPAPFREFNLSIADYALVYDECGNPVHPPTSAEAALPLGITHSGASAPQIVSTADPGTQVINYRHEPLPMRLARRDCSTGAVTRKSGAAGEMHNVFRSSIHGDPATPLLEAHEGDRVQVRLLQGAQHKQHVFSIHGLKWLREPDDRDSGFTNGQPIGISEHFELESVSPATPPNSENGVADHLYQSAVTDDLWNGAWGILRTLKKTSTDLLPLPGSRPTPPANLPTCPAGAPIRPFKVHALRAQGNLPGNRLVYNGNAGLYDPDAILFVHEYDLPGLRWGTRAPEPLILRAAAGDCIKLTLVNELPASFTHRAGWNYNTPIVDGFNTNQVKPSNRVSLHPQLLHYDVTTDDGADVGLNAVQSVGPGESRQYTWYAGEVVQNDGPGPQWIHEPIEFGAVNLRDMADVITHGMHGAVGALIVEPKWASWMEDPGQRAQATVRYIDPQGGPTSFREFVVVLQDELNLFTDNATFRCGDAAMNCDAAIRNTFSFGDVGHKAVNYRTEPVWKRLGLRPETPSSQLNNLDLSNLFSSTPHGDPATPVFTATSRQKIRVRVTYPSGHLRRHAFSLWGAEWPHIPWAAGSASRAMGANPHAMALGTQGGIGPMTAWNIVPFDDAGGRHHVPGDRLYLNQPTSKLSGGLWGIFRVTP
ncbi:copper oxidase [Chondromyces crocatus]|uniref:Multicopper oxidase n=1 Tax=Chondromyces crocatus TaxID=52 RepID=A0A0K1EQ87_CHOCO|nr:copper oxidase [Chondromyces crocatus]AKT42984.1 multicopper oxidase [Chondromyces crocatus]